MYFSVTGHVACGQLWLPSKCPHILGPRLKGSTYMGHSHSCDKGKDLKPWKKLLHKASAQLWHMLFVLTFQ